MTRSMGRRGTVLGAVAALALVGVLPATATPTEEPVTWPAPGERAQDAQPRDVSGAPVDVQLVRDPLDVVEEDAEAGATASFTVSADVLFESGEDTLGTAAQEALDNLVTALKDAGVAGPAVVAGHTDDVGEDAPNLELSQRRAQTVTTWLEPKLGNTGITLTPQGLGESQPLVANEDDASRARNRRVSVVFTTAQEDRSEERRPSDIAVGPFDPAPDAPATGGPDDSIVGTQRSIPTDDGDVTIRLDVTRADVVGGLLAVETRARLVAGPKDSFSGYGGLFSGVTHEDSVAPTVLYDVDNGQQLRPVLNAEGTVLAGDVSGSLDEGAERLGWLLFPLPDAVEGVVPLYVPAFGVLTVPVTR
ncbi:OmpA family protein [Thalassiella azotivora]